MNPNVANTDAANKKEGKEQMMKSEIETEMSGWVVTLDYLKITATK